LQFLGKKEPSQKEDSEAEASHRVCGILLAASAADVINGWLRILMEYHGQAGMYMAEAAISISGE
jgi:hypothetical protein